MSTGSTKSARKSADVEDSAAKKKCLATPNPTASAPQSDSGSQPSSAKRELSLGPFDRAVSLKGIFSMPGVDIWYYGHSLARSGTLLGNIDIDSIWPYPDLFWPRLGGFHIESISKEEVKVTWHCGDLSALSEWFPERMALRSDSFPLVGATWNLFASFDPDNVYSLFGINVKERRPQRPVLACDCDINFSCFFNDVRVTKNIKCNFILESCGCHWKTRDFLSKSELDKIFQSGSYITCHILVKELTNEGAKITHSSSCGKDQLLPEDNEELPMVSSKVFKDFKNLLQSGEGADVTLQVQDQQFKAHRIIIAARSSVFAAMIQNDMQENATGVVNVEDCDPASFPVLLEFLYCGGTEHLFVGNVFSLYKSADKYDVQDLKMRCLQFMKHNLSVETFCQTLRISFEYPETNLLTVATEFFIRHFKQISSTSEWETFLSENPVKGNKLFMETAKIKFQ